jgi:flagella basal body P-ring formation protein FlgA
VRLPADAEAIQLGHIAELEGGEAQTFADLVIRELDGLDSAVELSVRDVRAALDDADAHWGRINLTGRSVVVRLPRSALVRAPKPMQQASVSLANPAGTPGDDDGWRTANTLIGQNSIAGAVATELARALDVGPANLRLSFKTSSTGAATASPLDAHRVEPTDVRFELTPQDSILNERITFIARRWSGGSASPAQRLEVRAQILMSTVKAARDLERSAILASTDVSTDRAWLAPDHARRMVDLDAINGQRATRSLAAGELIEQRDVEPPVVIERGDRVNVRCLVGGVVITLTAEALEDAAEGDSFELRKIGERSTFVATATAPGEATVDVESARRNQTRTADRRR